MEPSLAFGPFVFDPAAGELRRDGVPVAGLGKRGTALLEALLQAGGEPVGKDELLGRAWPGQIVEEANLSVQIAALRKALGTAENGASWIATVPGIGYRFLRTAPEAAPAGSARASIAVLPFENLSGDAEQGYFAEGVVEDLTTALSRFKGFAVAARSSLHVYGADQAQLARTLGVRYLLAGSVRRRGDALRVTARLLDATGGTLWSEQFDGAMAELFDFQDRIVDAVVGRIEPEVRRAEIERARRKRPESLDAYDLYLRSLPYFRGTDPAARAEAVRLLEGAIALDPDFATALAYGAWAYDRHEMFGTDAAVDQHATTQARALELAERAIAVGHDDPQVMAIAAMVMIFIGHDWPRGLAMLDDAHRANPNNPTVLSLYGIANVMQGNLLAGRAAYLRALEISPAALDNFELFWGVALSHLVSGEYEESLDWSLRSLAANPDWLAAYWLLASAYGHLNRLEEGREMIARLLARSPDLRLSHIRDGGEHNVVLEGLRKVGMPE